MHMKEMPPKHLPEVSGGVVPGSPGDTCLPSPIGDPLSDPYPKDPTFPDPLERQIQS
jgi:hypothetical protein